MAAEGDGLALLVAAIRVAAIAGRKFDQRQMARIDFDAAELTGSASKIGMIRRNSA
jgi:hypothetical protein